MDATHVGVCPLTPAHSLLKHAHMRAHTHTHLLTIHAPAGAQEEAVARLRALLAQARALLKEAGVTHFMADDPGPPPGPPGGKPSHHHHAIRTQQGTCQVTGSAPSLYHFKEVRVLGGGHVTASRNRAPEAKAVLCSRGAACGRGAAVHIPLSCFMQGCLCLARCRSAGWVAQAYGKGPAECDMKCCL